MASKVGVDSNRPAIDVYTTYYASFQENEGRRRAAELTGLNFTSFLLAAWTNVIKVHKVTPVGHESLEELLMVIMRVWRIEIREEDCPQT